MTGVRAIVLTSSMRRHAYVANTLAARLDVACVWRERKSFDPLGYAENPDDERVIRQHFDARDASEATFFADHDEVHAPVRAVPGGLPRVPRRPRTRTRPARTHGLPCVPLRRLSG